MRVKCKVDWLHGRNVTVGTTLIAVKADGTADVSEDLRETLTTHPDWEVEKQQEAKAPAAPPPPAPAPARKPKPKPKLKARPKKE